MELSLLDVRLEALRLSVCLTRFDCERRWPDSRYQVYFPWKDEYHLKRLHYGSSRGHSRSPSLSKLDYGCMFETGYVFKQNAIYKYRKEKECMESYERASTKSLKEYRDKALSFSKTSSFCDSKLKSFSKLLIRSIRRKKK